MGDPTRSETHQPSRRAVAKVAVWSVPTIAFAVATPANATSPSVQPPGLQGWIAFYHPEAGMTSRYTVRGYNSGTHAFGTYGLWVTNTTAASSITGIRIFLHYLPGPASWSPRVPSSNWSDLVLVGTTTIGGEVHQTYRMDYIGTVVPAEGVTRIQNDMYFEASTMTYDRRPSQYIDRYVVVDGVELAFRRGRDQTGYTPLNANTPPNVPPTLPEGRLSRTAEGSLEEIDPSLSPS